MKNKTQQTTGWLDNFNDSKVSLPPGFVGEGTFNGPQWDSPAWGGQFQLGGNIYPVNYVPQAQDGSLEKFKELGSDAYTRMQPFYNTLFEAAHKYENPKTGMVSPFNAFRATAKSIIKNPEVLFMKKHNLPNDKDDPYHVGQYTVDQVGNRTHDWWPSQWAEPKKERPGIGNRIDRMRMRHQEKKSERQGRRDAGRTDCWGANCYGMENDGNYSAGFFPSGPISIPGGLQQEFVPDFRTARNLDFPTSDSMSITPMYGDSIVSKFKSPEGNIPIESIRNTAAMGASIPGSVGFTYARTNSPAPSNGPYAKKTKASAENGMTYYQHGLDWKPKSISRNGSFVPMADEGIELIDPPTDLPKNPITPAPLPMSPLMTTRGSRAKEKMESRMMTIKDPRKIRMTTGLAINPNKDLTSGNYDMRHMDQLMQRAKDKNLSEEDAWNLASIAFQETGWGKTDDNIGHMIGGWGKGDLYDDFIGAYQTKMKEADRLKIKDPYLRLQVYNGMGTITPKTEKNYHGFEMKKIYGVPIPKEGLSMKKNPLYGKQIVDVRDNVLRKNPEFAKYMGSYYKKKDGGVIEDDRGQWAHPGKITKINSNQITMKGVDYPVLGISDAGDRQMMYPGQDYTFKGKTVTEYPQKKKGGWLDKYN